MTHCTDWIGSRSQRLTAARTASLRTTSPYCVARQRLRTVQRFPMGRGERWHMCWTGYRIGCRTIAVTRTRDWWCSRAGRSRSTHPKMSPISARPRCGDCCAAHRPRTPGESCWPTSTTGPSADVAVAEATSRDESQLALRDGVCFAPRLVRPTGERHRGRRTCRGRRLATCHPRQRHAGLAEPLPSSVARIQSAPGARRSAHWRLRCTGVNFRDVLIALGLYPHPGADVGSEGSGVVLEVADDVLGFAPGDRVMGHVLRRGTCCRRRSSDDRARSLRGGPTLRQRRYQRCSSPRITRWHDLARVSAGERVLVHAATGGVGMAAVQLARHWGLDVYATASPGKWETLRSMGFDDDHIANSRTVDFEQKFSAATDGAGMDVVLDCSDRRIRRCIAATSAARRAIHRDGQDGYPRSRRGSGAASGCSVSSVRSSSQAGPDRAQEMLGELVKLFETGELRPLPVRSWDIRHASDAYRFLSRARHIGKLVLTVPTSLDPEGTVLITGGTGRARDAPRPASSDSSWCAEPVAHQPQGPCGRRCRRDRIRADRARCVRADRVVRRGGQRCVAGTSGRDTCRASVDRRHSRRRGARRRGVRGADATAPGRGAAAEDRCGVEPARTHRMRGPVGIRAVLVGSQCSRLPRSGQLRGRKCIPRCARTASPTAGAAGCLDGVGMVGASDRDDRPSRRARSRAHESWRIRPDVLRGGPRAVRCGAAAGALVRHAGTTRPRRHSVRFGGDGPATNVPWSDPCGTAHGRVCCRSRILFRSPTAARGDERVRTGTRTARRRAFARGRRAGARLRGRGWHGPGVQGAGLRFTGRGRVPESAQISDWSEAADHGRLRSSDTDRVGPVPGRCTRHRWGFRPSGRSEATTVSDRSTGR